MACPTTFSCSANIAGRNLVKEKATSLEKDPAEALKNSFSLHLSIKHNDVEFGSFWWSLSN